MDEIEALETQLQDMVVMISIKIQEALGGDLACSDEAAQK